MKMAYFDVAFSELETIESVGASGIIVDDSCLVEDLRIGLDEFPEDGTGVVRQDAALGVLHVHLVSLHNQLLLGVQSDLEVVGGNDQRASASSEARSLLHARLQAITPYIDCLIHKTPFKKLTIFSLFSSLSAKASTSEV